MKRSEMIKLMADTWRSISYSVEIETAMEKVLDAMEQVGIQPPFIEKIDELTDIPEVYYMCEWDEE